MIKLSIVFLNYNRLTETKYTTERLRLMVAHRNDVEVIAVDNGSIDGTADYLKQEKWLHAILLRENNGIAGYNVGFEQTKGKYLIVLDDDSCPDDWSSVEHAINHLEMYPHTGIVAFCVLSSSGKKQQTWHIPSEENGGPSMAFIGCGFAIRREVFQQAGWYPGHFFLYQNEVEVAIRVRKLGYGIYYEPKCKVIHRGDLTSRSGWRRVYYPTRNTIWIIRHYYPYPEAFYLIFSRLMIGLVRSIWFGEIKGYLRAVHDAFKEPVVREILPQAIREDFSGFWQQNSFYHQLLFYHSGVSSVVFHREIKNEQKN